MNQQNYHPVVCFGEALWDVLPSGRLAGGAPTNVAYHLQKLGKNPAVISKVGFDELGKELIETLEAKGVCTDYFQIDYEKPTSVVTATPKSELEMAYNIVEDVAWDYIEAEPDALHIVREAEYFVFGTLAARCKKSLSTLLCLLEVAQKKVLDVNLRSPFYNRDLLELLLTRADVVKLSLDELELVTGWFTHLHSEIDRMKLMKDQFDIHSVIVTRGAKGAVINVGDEWHSCKGLSVKVADTVGSGDSFLAAVIAKQLDGVAVEETLHYANQLAAFIATKKGACPDYELEEVEQSNIFSSI